MPSSICDEQGREINAVYGYLLFVAQFLKKARPQYLAFAFDESLSTCFRNKIYPDYKSSRTLPDTNLAYQLKLCRKFSQILDLSSYASKRYEADDLLGSLAFYFRKQVSHRVYVTRDKDMGQLLGSQDRLWDFASQAQENESSTCQDFYDRFGVRSEQFPDYLALVGDATDDIPGVPGIGAKAASRLLQEFNTLENLYQQLDNLHLLELRSAKRIQHLLVEYKELAHISKRLATIKSDIVVAQKLSELRWSGVDLLKFESALKRHHIKGRAARSLLNAFEELSA
jgi:DNA polymerase I